MLLSHGDSSWSPGHREVTFLGMGAGPRPTTFLSLPFWGCLQGAWQQAGKGFSSHKLTFNRSWAPTGQPQTLQGACISWALLLCSPSLSPRSGGHFMSTAEKIRLPDDCTIGYIIESVLGVKLIRSNLFHSHLENLHQVPKSEIHKQVPQVVT